jgi:hypothetical protein
MDKTFDLVSTGALRYPFASNFASLGIWAGRYYAPIIGPGGVRNPLVRLEFFGTFS